jgi:hypothetical protein
MGAPMPFGFQPQEIARQPEPFDAIQLALLNHIPPPVVFGHTQVAIVQNAGNHNLGMTSDALVATTKVMQG